MCVGGGKYACVPSSEIYLSLLEGLNTAVAIITQGKAVNCHSTGLHHRVAISVPCCKP